MTAFSRIDVREATRLTRAGKLAEATALLRGEPQQTYNRMDAEGQQTVRNDSGNLQTIDVVPSSTPGGAWIMHSVASPGRDKPPGQPTLLARMQAFGDRIARSHSVPEFSEGLRRSAQIAVPVPEGARFEDRMFAGKAGSRTYKVFVPSGYEGQALPLVVMLHGCTQSPDDFAAGTRMNEVAEEQTFLVVYPAQPQSANMQKCWNWFRADDQRREGGEPSLIAGITRQAIQEFSADQTRIYVAGLSAGGAAAAIMAETYPDVFAAVGIHSGLACGAARDMSSAFKAMNGGVGTQRPRPANPVPTIVFHGDGDRTVHPVNGDRVIAQAHPAAKLGKATMQGETQRGMAYTRTVQTDDAGREVLEQWLLRGAGHAWSGGSPSGSYTEPRGPDASREMMRFFLAHTNTAMKAG